MQPAVTPSDRPRLPIQAILRQTQDLPVLPGAIMRVIQLTGNSDATSRAVAEAIGMDQAVTAKVLRLANSSFYGLPRKVTSLQEAVILLGFRTVRLIAMVAGTSTWMSRPLKGYDLPPRQLMRHSMGLALGCQMIARIGQFDPDEAFVAGLLADIGKIAIDKCIDGKISLMMQLGIKAGMTFEDVERTVLGHTHSEIGAHMAENWNLPQEIVEGIKWHHDPTSAGEAWLPHVIHLADVLAMMTGFGIGGDGLQYKLCEDSLEICRLSAEDFDGLIEQFVGAVLHGESLFDGM
ncbi:MAG: HDOD domain-containing protein [Chthonomonas sp.]|nr:HDOD domain-containing protein [Chthonomonas sp.]